MTPERLAELRALASELATEADETVGGSPSLRKAAVALTEAAAEIEALRKSRAEVYNLLDIERDRAERAEQRNARLVEAHDRANQEVFRLAEELRKRDPS